MKVVLDTNVLVSGIFFGGVPGKLLDAWTEFLTKSWIAAIAEHAHHVLDPAACPRICRDPHDDKFLYCSMSVKADYLVTGDKDLQVLKDVYSFKIISPKAFLTVLKK